MSEMFKSPLFGIILSLAVYSLCFKLKVRFKSDLLNPLLLSSILIIAILLVFKIPYESFNHGGQFVTALIGPATVALAIPLYQNIHLVKKHYRILLVSIITGVVVHAALLGLLALVLNLDTQMVATLLPKSVTTAIAKDISTNLGGITTLTISIVILTGILGAATAPLINKIFKINDPMAQGLALGTAAHAVGTSKAVEMGEMQGTMSSLALILTGLMTVVASPIAHQLISTFLGS